MYVVVDIASRFLFSYLLQSKASVGVTRKLLGLPLTFGIPMIIGHVAVGEFTAKVVAHVCQWLRV